MKWRQRPEERDMPGGITSEGIKKLDELAEELRKQNPGLEILRGEGAVWVREGKKDFGIYSWFIGGGVVKVYDFEKRSTVLSRCVDCGEPCPPHNCQKECPQRPMAVPA